MSGAGWKRLWACLIVVLASSPQVRAAPGAEGSDPPACNLNAWSTDSDPKGLNVRAAPRADAPVIGRLPPPRAGAGESFAVEVHVVGSKDGWFLIDRAQFEDYGDGKAETVFKDRGWVSGRYLTFSVGSPAVYAEPSETARKVVKLSWKDQKGNAAGPDSFAVERFTSCKGDWAEVEGTFAGPNTRHKGWVTKICSNQVTTCP